MKKGFSLVELAIVLVILGLLVGGILLGQNLIRAAELRSVPAQFKEYETAFNLFQEKYLAFPGDMKNAVDFWGAQAGGTDIGYDSTCAALLTPATGEATCNGDGDGDIAPNNAELYEGFRAWQHLANAGMIGGSFSGVTAHASDPTTWQVLIGSNVPEGKMSNTGFTIRWYIDQSDDSHGTYYRGLYGNMMWFGTAGATSPYTNGFVLTPAEAWTIDQKIDDGSPSTGWIRTPKSWSDCVTSTNADSAEYKITNEDTACGLMLMLE